MWLSLSCVLLAVILLLAGAAIATYASQHSIDDLDETQDEFNSTECQENRKEGHIPLHNVLRLMTLGPCIGLHKVPSLSVGKGVVPHTVGITTLWSFGQAQRRHNDAVARSRNADESSQYRRKHCASLAVVFTAAAATIVVFLQPNEHKRWQEYQYASAYNAGKVPHKATEVVLISILRLPIRKVEQNISYDAEDSKQHQRVSDVSCTLAKAHGGSGSPAGFLTSLSSAQRCPRSDNSVPVCRESRRDSQPIPATT